MTGDPAIGFHVFGNVCIQQVKRHAPNVSTPNLRAYDPLANQYFHKQRRAVFSLHLIERQLFRISFTVKLFLPADEIEALAKVTVVIKQPDRYERQIQIARRLQMIAGEYAKTARVERQRIVNAILGAKICYGIRCVNRLRSCIRNLKSEI